MSKVYLDASFVSACVTDRTDSKSLYRRDMSRDWWMTQRQRHHLFVSQEVLDELSSPQFKRSEEALAWIAAVPLVPLNEEVRAVARVLVSDRVMPEPAIGDAVHVAASTVHGCEYLLSWNVRHLANPNKTAHLEVVCRRIGFRAPKIVTPEFLWED